MPEIRMNSLESWAMNWGPLSEMIRGVASALTQRLRSPQETQERETHGTDGQRTLSNLNHIALLRMMHDDD
jgi:hypothetical protein